MGSRVQSTIARFPELCFLKFSVLHVLVGLRKQFINNFVFPARAIAAGFNNNKKFLNNMPCSTLSKAFAKLKKIAPTLFDFFKF